MDRLLVFDYDGVLVESYDVFKRHFLQACRAEDIDAVSTEEDFLSLFDGNLYQSMLRQGMSRDQVLTVVFSVRDGVMQEQEAIQLFPGVRETVHTLADNNILAVVTSNDTRVVQHFLKARGIDRFDDVIGSDKEPSKQAKLDRLQQHYDATCYYIGDTAGDIVEGQKANVATIAVAWGWHDEQRLRKAGPDHLLHRPTELLSLFSR